MSYEIKFLHKAFEQSWEDAFEANEEKSRAFEAESAEARPPITEQMEQLASSLQGVNHRLSKHDEAGFIKLSDDESGAQLLLYEHEVKILIPYNFVGRHAQGQMTRAYKYAKIIERDTGMIGYDPQREDTFLHSEDSIMDAVALLSETSKRRGGGGRQEVEKPWWKFW